MTPPEGGPLETETFAMRPTVIGLHLAKPVLNSRSGGGGLAKPAARAALSRHGVQAPDGVPDVFDQRRSSPFAA